MAAGIAFNILLYLIPLLLVAIYVINDKNVHLLIIVYQVK